ncbi:TorF family putative porin [Luteimonas aquatica]|uniref:TorF family putative porin n=1 Tax=Luteimonas aquatica TaxID=450364 RepID=UPI001F579626|nr:TorF family putative porin [Luteimonas aquatica]
MSFRNTAIASTLSLLLLGTGHARAAVTGSAALTSDYVFRGVSQTDEDPALQAGIEYAHDSGFYLGAWGSNISWLSDIPGDVSSSLELDGYLGYRGKAGEAVSYDVGVLSYYYPGDFPDGFSRADTTELYLGATLAPTEALSFGLKYSYALTELFGYSDSDGSGYLDASLNWTFSPGWTLNLHGGKQWIEKNADFEYTDWKVGLTKAFDNGFSIAAAYTDTDADEALYTNAHGTRIADGRFAVTFTKAF